MKIFSVFVQVMKDWSDLEERYQDMRAEDATSAEDFKKAMTERFQKTVQVGEWRPTLSLSPLAGVLWAEIVDTKWQQRG